MNRRAFLKSCLYIVGAVLLKPLMKYWPENAVDEGSIIGSWDPVFVMPSHSEHNFAPTGEQWQEFHISADHCRMFNMPLYQEGDTFVPRTDEQLTELGWHRIENDATPIEFWTCPDEETVDEAKDESKSDSENQI